MIRRTPRTAPPAAARRPRGRAHRLRTWRGRGRSPWRACTARAPRRRSPRGRAGCWRGGTAASAAPAPRTAAGPAAPAAAAAGAAPPAAASGSAVVSEAASRCRWRGRRWLTTTPAMPRRQAPRQPRRRRRRTRPKTRAWRRYGRGRCGRPDVATAAADAAEAEALKKVSTSGMEARDQSQQRLPSAGQRSLPMFRGSR